MSNRSNFRLSIARKMPTSLMRQWVSVKKLFKRTPPDERVYFDSRTVSNGHHKVTYKGIKAIKCPFDYVIYQMLIWELKPDLIIEIGTSQGGGATYLADLLEMTGSGIVHTIDLDDSRCDPRVKSNPRICFFTGGWEAYDIKNSDGFKKILVIEDGSHTYESSLGALKKFAPLVSIGSYYIVEDGIVSELDAEKEFDGGPLKAIREFLSSSKNFEVDRKYCNMFGENATFNVNGYLKRTS